MRVIVTGGNGGIGKGIATAMAAQGHQVVIACRTIPKAKQAVAEMRGDVDIRYLDLADLSSIGPARHASAIQTAEFTLPFSRSWWTWCRNRPIAATTGAVSAPSTRSKPCPTPGSSM